MNLKRYYKPDLKEEFIKAYNDGTTEPYTWNSIFARSAVMEEVRDKDVCNFTYDEIERLLTSFRSTSVSRLSSILSLFTAYTDFCIQNNFSLDNQNHFREIDRKNLMVYVDKRKAEFVYISENSIMKIINTVGAYRDKYIVLGLFSGIVGKDYEDLIELDKEDLLGNNKIRIRSTNEIRTVDPELYDIMVKASEEYKIPVENGSTWDVVGTKVFKPIATKRAKVKADKAVLAKRLAKIRVVQSMPMFGTKTITNSGFCNQVVKFANKNNYDIKSAFKHPYVQKLKSIYRMPKRDSSCIKIVENYILFTKNENKNMLEKSTG